MLMGLCLFLLVVFAIASIVLVSGPKKLWATIPGVLFVVVLVLSSIVYVPQGSVGVKRSFGIIQTDSVVPQGTIKLFGQWPWESVQAENTKNFNQEVEFEGRTKDLVVVKFKMTQPVRVNPDAYPWIQTKVHGDWQAYIQSYLGASLRNAVTTKGYMEVYSSDHVALASVYEKDIRAALTKALTELGVPESVAKDAFILADPQFGPPHLPHEIEDSLHKQVAVKIDQETAKGRAIVALNDVETRRHEGEGYDAIFAHLPKDVQPHDAAELINAQNGSIIAHTFQEGVRTGKISSVTVIVGGQSSPSTSVPVGKK